jgi:hypothetical protein
MTIRSLVDGPRLPQRLEEKYGRDDPVRWARRLTARVWDDRVVFADGSEGF